MATAPLRDEPWRRLPWLLPAAIIVGLMSLMGFLRLLTQPSDRSPSPKVIEIGIVELPTEMPVPAQAAPASAPPPEPITAPLTEPEIAPPPDLKPPPEPEPPPHVEPPAEPTVEAKPEPPPPRPQKRPPPPKPARTPAVPRQAAAPSPDTATAPSQQTPPPTPPAANPQPSGSSIGARVLYQPMPQIPDELRRRRLDVVALVVFHIAKDGSAKTELREATDDPRLNQVLLDGFKRWRFFPALEHDQPVPSTLELRVPIQIR